MKISIISKFPLGTINEILDPVIFNITHVNDFLRLNIY